MERKIVARAVASPSEVSAGAFPDCGLGVPAESSAPHYVSRRKSNKKNLRPGDRVRLNNQRAASGN
jgi:hypothetical protein